MKKKSKLAIQHYYNEEVEKLGKSPSGFPIQVLVRYKNVMTIFSSRIGMRYSNLGAHYEQAIRDYSDIAEKIIKDEKNYIIKVRDYIEDKLGKVFKPPILVKTSLEVYFLKNIKEYFDSYFDKYDFEVVLYQRGLRVGVEILHIIGPTKYLHNLYQEKNDTISAINGKVDLKSTFDSIVEKRDYKLTFEAFLQVLEIQDKIESLDLLSFRLLEVEESPSLVDFKKSFDQKFDEDVINILKYDKNYIKD